MLPPVTAVTRPVAFIVATDVLLLVHVPDGIALMSLMVSLGQTPDGPLIAAATGIG